MIEDLISRVFYARNVAHWNHWRTKSYSEHKALGKFYEDVIEAVDMLVEVYQGVNGLVGAVPAPKNMPADVMDLLKADAEWIEENHEKICGGNRAIANQIDSVTAVYLSTVYKLENLK